MEHLISLSVGTKGVDDHAQTYQDLSELARNLGVTHNYVNVSSSIFGETDEDDVEDSGCMREHLFCDEDTLTRARFAITEAGFTEETAEEIVHALMNAGILFRERIPTEG